MTKSARRSASWRRGEVRRATSASVRDGARGELIAFLGIEALAVSTR
jgi:hypothetical protein